MKFVVIGIVVLISLVADWLFFKPRSIASFLIVEALVIGALYIIFIDRTPQV